MANQAAWDGWYDTLKEHLRANASTLVREWIPGGKTEGDEYKPLNPTRADKTPGSFSINLSTGQWADFADGESGRDLISLYKYINGTSDYQKAAIELADKLGMSTSPDREADAPASEWPTHPSLGKPTATYVYSDVAGDPHNGVAVWYRRSKKRNKDIRQYDFRTKTWRAPHHAILYNLPQIVANPKAGVLVVEGEKCADALTEQLAREGGTAVVTTWPGGTGAVAKADWSALRGHPIVLIPDDDLIGRQAMLRIARSAMALGCGVRVADMYHHGGTGYDVADALHKRADFKAAFAGALGRDEADPAEFEKKVKRLEMQAKGAEVPNEYLPPHEKQDVQDDTDGFIPIGFCPTGDGNVEYYILSIRQDNQGTGIVHRFLPSAMTKANLLSLAGLEYWESRYAAGRRGSVSWDLVSTALINACQRKGLVSLETARRGKGVWRRPSDRRIIIHAGDQAYVNDNWISLYDAMENGFLLEAAAPVVQLGKPEVEKEDMKRHALAFLEACRNVEWRTEDENLNGDILAGWCAIAPFAGALNWRPHIMLQGPAECGKSTLLRDLVGPATAPWRHVFEGGTTESGLRRAVPRDAVPVLFDEGEADIMKRREKMQEIMHLLRASSSESGGFIQHGDGRSYRVRCAFCIAAISPELEDSADRSRVTMLSMKPQVGTLLSEEGLAERTTKWRRLWECVHSLPDNWGKELFWHIYDLRYELGRRRTEFHQRIIERFQDPRLGDQLSPMLAAATLLEHPDKITADIYEYTISRISESITFEATELDQDKLLSFMLSTDFEVRTINHKVRTTLGRAIEVVREHAGLFNPDDVSRVADITERLRECGFILDFDAKRLLIANTGEHLERMLRQTRWGKNWSRALHAINGAVKVKGNSYGGRKARGVAIPFSVLDSELLA